MEVRWYSAVKKEVEKLHAQDFFQQAVEHLRLSPWDTLLRTRVVKPLQGRNLSGAYEIRPGGYRAMFILLVGGEAYVFGFFKKEGERLKRTQLLAVEQRLKNIRRMI